MESEHSAHEQQRQAQHHQAQQLLQFAQTSYETNPTDALSALMDAMTLTTGTGAAAHVAIERIRSELGDIVADRVAGNASTLRYSSQLAPAQLSEREMTLKAMEVVRELLDDTSTILYAQGRQHLLQQAMEDGSSVVCSKCGDMIARDRWTQHTQYWCSSIEEKSCDGEGDMEMDG
jgi:hypothetical protein